MRYPSRRLPLLYPEVDFEGDDGTLVVDGLGRGWVDAPNMEDPAIDKLSRTGDDSF